MKKETFEHICKIIQKVANSIPHSEMCGDWKDRLFKAYDDKRLEIRRDMKLKMGDDLIDRHKIAAAMTSAILEVKPIICSRKKLVMQRLPNVFAALITSLVILVLYKESCGGEGLFESINKMLSIPAVDGSTYGIHLVQAFYALETQLSTIKYHCLAHIYFLMEEASSYSFKPR
jgi:hypothetical protein